jgi:hypothetical protein
MSTLNNFLISITAPKGVIPDLAQVGKNPEWLQRVSAFFAACGGSMAPGAPGECQINVGRGRTNAGFAKAFQTLALASVAADTVIEINGIPFSAVNGAATTGNNEFDMSGADTADASALCAAAVASTTVGIVGDITACNLAGTITLVSVTAGQVVKLEGVPFIARAYATGNKGDFDISGSDTADATALAAAINAHNYIGGRYVATAASNVVTVRQRTGTTGASLTTEAATMTLGGLSSGKLAATATILLGSSGPGTDGNAMTVITKGVVATGTVTYSGSSGAQTVVINGVTVYNATGASDAANATAAAAAINASTNTAIAGLVRAVARAGVVKIFAVKPGLLGNGLTLSATGTGATASGARLTGGTVASSEGVQATQTYTISGGSGTLTATINGVAVAITWATSDNNSAILLQNAINANTSLHGLVYATIAANVVTVNAVRGGLAGNQITTTATGTGLAAGAATLASGSAPTTFVPGAERMSGGVGGNDTAPVNFQF